MHMYNGEMPLNTLDKELREIAGHLDNEEMMEMALKLQRWVGQLKAVSQGCHGCSFWKGGECLAGGCLMPPVPIAGERPDRN